MEDMKEMLSKEEDPFTDPDYEISTDSSDTSSAKEAMSPKSNPGGADQDPKTKGEASPQPDPQPELEPETEEAEAEIDISEFCTPWEDTYQTKPKPFHRALLSVHFHAATDFQRFADSISPWYFFHQNSHKACDLAAIFTKFCLPSPINIIRAQVQATLTFAEAAKEENVLHLETTGTASDIDVLLAYFVLFDRFFFFEAMTWYWETGVLMIELGSDQRCEFHGQCISYFPQDALFVPLHDETKTTIIIETSQNEDRKMRLTFYLETLLHQMIHAFLAIYGCRRFGCNKQHRNEGRQSHGEAWQEMAFHVERGAKDHFGLALNLNRKWAYVWELASNQKRVVPEKAQSWGFDSEEIAKEVECCLYSSDIGLGLKKGCTIEQTPLIPKLQSYTWKWLKKED